jgi:hypothetical protein
MGQNTAREEVESDAGKGPSDPQAEGGRGTNRRTAQGVDANASKHDLYEVAQKLDIGGRSKMSKGDLVKAIQKANASATRKSRKK